MLTEQNHTRAARFIGRRAGIPVYLPESIPEAVEPWESARVKQIGEFEVYKAGPSWASRRSNSETTTPS